MAMDKADLYEKAEEYWTNASADVDGMLGGFAELHEPDVQQSRQFLLGLKQKKLLLRMDHALDCGGGIGRVTKHLLIPMFGKVDMEELVEELVEQSFEYIGKDPRMGERFVEGLQTFTPPKGRYDLIWIQWVSGHLTEDDFIAFFQRCKEGLREGGVICLKDNLASGETADFDAEDHSWCRPEKDILSLFDRAGLKLVHKQAQTNFPKGMYKVKMFALK